MANAIIQDLVLSTTSETQGRVETVFPGPADKPIVLKLIQLPIDQAVLEELRVVPMDGWRVWTNLHGMGIRWGDMDQFQWPDDSRVSDYLFWAEVDDGEIGYALPERIGAGQQHFTTVRFTFDIARSPAPSHVLGQMVRAAEAFANTCDCTLGCFVDATYVDSPAELYAAVDDVVTKLAALGIRVGSSTVCQLR